jgi:hypothetical protein
MNPRIVLRVLFALVVVAAIVGIGVYAYNLGVAQGLAESGKLATPSAGFAPHSYYGGPFFFRPFGFGLAGCLFPLLFVCLIFALLRGLFWHKHWGGHHGHWGKGVPPMFEEWHRRAHEGQTTDQ